jgi:uncharacterized membrane protein HdeD (DUF308 family)
METTLFLAQFMGAFSIIAACSMFFERKMLLSIFDQTAKNRALLYMIGVAEVIGGLLITLQHQSWSPDLPLVVSLLGWLLLLEGIIYVFLPMKSARSIFKWLHDKQVYYLIALCYLLVGIYLAYSGFAV